MTIPDNIQKELQDFSEYIDAAVELDIHQDYSCMQEFIKDAAEVWYSGHEDREAELEEEDAPNDKLTKLMNEVRT